MRKIKKINGYLVVRFNDREKRNNEGLGSYGVIDAELYTGNLDIDRSALEYEDADSLEIAVEQARSLESELDITEEPPTYTVVVETDDRVTENEVEPQLLIDGWERQLATQIRSHHYPDTDPRTAAHELYGFKMALHKLKMLDEYDVAVNPDHFAPGGTLGGPLPKSPEAMLSYICDEKCKERIPGRTQDELDAVCEQCAVVRFFCESLDRELRAREKALGELNELLIRLGDASQPPRTARRVEYGARQYLRALRTMGLFTESKAAASEARIDEAMKQWEETPAPTPCCTFEDDGYRSVGLMAGGVLSEMSPHDYVETEIVKGCAVQVLKCRKCGHESYAWFEDPELKNARKLLKEINDDVAGEEVPE